MVGIQLIKDFAPHPGLALMVMPPSSTLDQERLGDKHFFFLDQFNPNTK